MKYLAAGLAIFHEARAHGKIRTAKVDEGLHPIDIPTKPLEGREEVYKWARILGLEGGVPPLSKARPEGGAGHLGVAPAPAGPARRPSGPAQRGRAAPASAGTAARYEQLTPGSAPLRLG
mmetsp:Transcript_21101/g.47604  ORF Transcript_21101/g.47604 Transcript_21101/m.47604 type:complete len:120 (+) Transcript_21101:374-733(+)